MSSSSGGSTNPILMPSDLKFYFSGGYFNSEPTNSIGGDISSFAIQSGRLNGLFDRVDTVEATEGDVEFRCIYLRNTSQTRKLLNARIWIETGTASAKTAISISIGSGGINGTEPLLPGEGTYPPMQFFEIPLTEPEEPNIGDLYPGDHIGLWVAWTVQPGTESIEDDFAVIRIDGEREPESISDPLPGTNPPGTTDPPPSGCPQGSKWDPVSAVCVDDSTVIICPQGYTYDNTTQRCVPPTTPPPSIPNWTFAAAGDFSCTSDATATMNLIGSKLDKTAGDNVGLFLALGDYSYEDGDLSCWYSRARTPLGTTIYPANVAPNIGNHETSEDGSSSDRTSLINEFPMIPSAGYYAFTRKNIRFIVMDTNSNYNSGSAQHTFVSQQLQQARGDANIKWIIMSYHKPSFGSASYYAPLTDFRNIYHPLFDQYKVDLIFNGHNHIYFRSKPVTYNSSSPGTPTIASDQATGNYINIDGRVFVTSGAGGRSSHTEFDGSAENFVGFRHAPSPHGASIITLQDNGHQLKCQFITNAGQVLDDFTLSKPGASLPPSIQCPQGFHYSETLGRCVVSPQTCPINYTWSPEQNRCIANSGTPQPPGPVDPLAGVTWIYDATATLNTPQTITAGNYDSTQQILKTSSYADASSFSISGGYITIPGAGAGASSGSANTRLGIDYWKLSNFSSDTRVGRSMAYQFTFRYNNNISITVMDGNDYPTGVLSPAKIFGGFQVTFLGPGASPDLGTFDGSSTRVAYFFNPSTGLTGQGEPVFSSYPGNRSFEVGKDYKVFGTFRTNPTTNSVVANTWIDFGDGTGWVKVVTDHTFSSSNWSPGTVPSGYDDTSAINSGPTAIRRHRIVIRNNNSGVPTPRPDLMVKDIKVGVMPNLPDSTTPPPGTDPPGGGTPSGGVLDSNGIRWYMATGQQGVINQTRNESSDDRWSGNVSNVSQYGYEAVIYLTIPNIASGGHIGFKHWGPNHSGDCGHEEGGDCCCWYDTGLRHNGDVYQEIERPHPNNDGWNKGKLIQNIGRGLGGQTTGVKWLVYPLTPGGSADNGGIKLRMWVDTSGLSNGKPQNQWRLCYDTTDTGDILGDYPNPSFEHDLEVRNSDSSGQSTYAGGLHWRKCQAGDTDKFGTGTGGGGGTTTPPPSSSTAFKLLSWGDNDTTSDARAVLNMMMTEQSVEQYLFAGDGPYSTSSTNWINMMSGYFNTSTLKNKLMLAQGNHEHPESESQQSEDQIEAWFPGLHNSVEGLEWLQAKQVRNCYIIVMNSQDEDIDQIGGAQYNWVQARLNDAVALRNSGQIDWIITMVHKSWFNLLGSNPAYVTARNAYKTMFRNAQVDFMFHGHNHSYCIWRPIVSIDGNNDNTAAQAVFTMSGSNYNFAVDHGAFYIINGNGGHEINRWGENPADFANVLYANDTEYGYTVLEIDGKRATITAKSVGGNVRYTVTAVR